MIKIFDKEVKLKSHQCSLFGIKGQKIESPYVNLFIRTAFCNASCAFCVYSDDASKYNSNKLQEILVELKSKVEIGKIAITGGEPTLNWEDFKSIIKISKEISPFSELSLNTNGFRWNKLFEHDLYKLFDHIHLSRQHYDDDINNKIFNTDLPTSKEIKDAVLKQTNPHQVHLKFNLIKEHIHSKEEIFKYLDWSNSMGINDIGINSLMPVNDFSIQNFVPIENLKDDNFLITKKWERHEGGCECFNYIYIPENNFRRPIRVYHKNTFRPSDIQENLVFDGQNLRLGWDGEIIY